jgi:hypothetical protein
MWRILQHPKPDDFVIASGSAYSLADFTAAAFGDGARSSLGTSIRHEIAMPDVVRMMVQAELNERRAA